MSLKQSIGLFHLTRGLGSPGPVKVVLDSQNLRDPLGDFGWEGWPTVALESPGKSKSRNNLINKDLNYLLGLFRGMGNASTHPANVSTKTRSNLEVGPPGR
jgi:hypothetical protein